MDSYAALFWLGFFVSIASHVVSVQAHTFFALTGTALMFLGSKLGREFLGIL